MEIPASISPRLNSLQCALTGAAVVVVMFAVCWAAAAAGFAGGSHMFVSLFTLASPNSLAALAEGLLWSVVFGGLGGALLAVLFNSFAFIARR